MVWMMLQQNESIYQSIEDFYDHLSDYYHYLFCNIGDFNRNLAQEIDTKILKPHKIRKILECACGTGHFLVELAKLGYEVTGIDLSNNLLEQAKSNARKSGVKANFAHANMLNLSNIGQDEFDFVICRGNSIPHLPVQDISFAIKNMSSVLKRGGICYIDTRDFDLALREKPLFEFRSHFRENSDDVIVYYIFDYHEDYRTCHVVLNFFNRTTNTIISKHFSIDVFNILESEMRTALKKAGFKDIEKLKLDNDFDYINTYLGVKG